MSKSLNPYKTLQRLLEAPGDDPFPSQDPMAGDPAADMGGFDSAPPMDFQDSFEDPMSDEQPDLPTAAISDTGKAAMCAILAFAESPGEAKAAIDSNPNAAEALKRLLKFGLVSSELSMYKLTDLGQDYLKSFGLSDGTAVTDQGKILATKYLFSR